jgi:hypothetical protein
LGDERMGWLKRLFGRERKVYGVSCRYVERKIPVEFFFFTRRQAWAYFRDGRFRIEKNDPNLGTFCWGKRCGKISVTLPNFTQLRSKEWMIESIAKTIAHEYVHLAIHEIVEGYWLNDEWPLVKMGLFGI